MQQKEYVWDLVSAKSYHSCLLTTFSFDFYYFENSVMRILRSKGIVNISVFIDSNIFDGLLGKIGVSGSRVYSLSPIKSNGCFHPKVYMFFGEKQGLLIVGSGNLTSSGHGKNDEIWGAFHFDATKSKYTQLFSNSWSFFELLSQNLKGFAKEKITWIKEYTPWIKTLPPPNSINFEALDESSQIALLNNNSETSIFQQLSGFVPYDKVKELTIVAPYFDYEGKIIQVFSKLLSKANINVLIDDKNGILPLGLDASIANQVNFYHWKDCFSNKGGNKNFSRLHAKFFNFSLVDNSQLCLFGSANASVAALGTENISAKNEEVSILLKSSGKDFLKDLGIKINPEKRKNLTEFEEGVDERTVFKKMTVFKYNIEAIDKVGNVLNVYVDKPLDANVKLHIFKNWGEEIYNEKLIKKNGHYSINMPTDLFNPIYACLKDANTSEIVSNKQIIQDVYELAKTNPDPQTQKFNELLNSIESGDEILILKLIDCITTEDFDAENRSFVPKVKTKSAEVENENNEIKGEVLDYEKFKDVSYDKIQHQYYVLNSTPNRVADIFTSLSHKIREEVANVEFDDEELESNIDDSQGRENQLKLKPIARSAFNKGKSRILKFFKKYSDYLENEVDKLIKKPNQKVDDEGKVSITELSNFVIALYLAIYYTDKKIQYFIDEEIHHEAIIKSYGFKYNDYKNLLTINTELIGKFLLLCARGFKKYDGNYLNERLIKLKREAFYHCVFCLAQAKWSSSNIKYKNLLLINAIHFLADDVEHLLELSQFSEEMNIRLQLSANGNMDLLRDIKIQIKEAILPKYFSFMENMNLCVEERKKVLSKDLMPETIIFTSGLGFCIVLRKKIQGDCAILTLSRPGFPWIEKEKEFLLEEKIVFKANIVF